ncbi:MAG: hypothetical protein N3I35_18235 [Clostridia bacterium]|nr:hypothetical protein [Clostridia bacterium]
MEDATAISRNIESTLKSIQKNQSFIGRYTDFMKFIDERGFRTNLRIAQNMYEEQSSFHKKIINIVQFCFKIALELLSRILDVLKEILSKLRPWIANGSNYSQKGKNAVYGIYSASDKINTIDRGVGSVTNNISITYAIKEQEKSKDSFLKKLWEKFFEKLLDKLLDKLIDNTISKILDKLLKDTLGKVFEKVADRIFPEKLGRFFDKLADKITSGRSGKVNPSDAGTSKQIPKIGGKAGSMLGSSIKAGLSSGLKVIGNVASTIFNGISKSGNNTLKLFGALSKSISKVNVGYGLLRLAALGASAAQWVLNSALLANPITWIVVGVIGLIAAIVLLVKHWDKVKEAVGRFWDFVVSIFSNIGSWFKKHVVDPVLSLMPSWLKKLFGVSGGASSKGGGGSFGGAGSNGSYRNGLAYVPYDGFIAELHQGERVLTASENKNYKNTGNSYNNSIPKGGNTFNITINGVNKSTNEIINELVIKIKETAGTMGEVAYSR